MSRKIGEALIERGHISVAQLEDALRAQLIFGGHLGTCLIELGIVDEDTFGRTLSEILGIPCATAEDLSRIPPEVIRLVRREVADEYRAIPFRADDRHAHVAMVDPTNLHDVDEVAFATGRRVVPYIAPEIRMMYALERYYDIPRPRREVRAVAVAPVAPRAAGAASPATSGSWNAAAGQLLGRGSAAAPAKSAPGSAGPAAVHLAPSTPAERPGCPLADVAERLCAAADRHALAAAVLGYAARRAARVMLLGVQPSGAIGWKSAGFPALAAERLADGVPVTGDWLFETLLGEGHYCGALPATPRAIGFFQHLGVPAPAEIFVAPIHVSERLAGVFYADWGEEKGKAQSAAAELLVLNRMLRHAMNRVVLAGKIRALVRVAPV